MKKRVAIITNDTSAVGGLPTMVSFLYRTLANSNGYQPEVISLATSAFDKASAHIKSPMTWLQGARVEKGTWQGLPVTHFGVQGSELEFQRYRPRRALTEHLQNYDLLQFVVGSPPWVCVADGVKRPIVLWTATTTRADRSSQMRNGSFVRRSWSSLMMPATERCERRALQLANQTLVLSEYTRDSIISLNKNIQVALAPCGVDTTVFRPASDGKGDYILCVARLSDPRKNVRLLLDAYEQLKQKTMALPDLVLVGDLPTPEVRKHLQDRGLAGKVHLVGPKSGDELAELYRRASFFVLSSNEEGLGIVILEAMASGLPVVSTDCGGPATAIVDGVSGFLTPVGDTNRLAQAMVRLVNDAALCAQFGSAAREIAVERFSLDRAGQVFLDTYDKLLTQGVLSPDESGSNAFVSVTA